jgi:hypothetical protein
MMVEMLYFNHDCLLVVSGYFNHHYLLVASGLYQPSLFVGD